jgi:hypothetical protein
MAVNADTGEQHEPFRAGTVRRGTTEPEYVSPPGRQSETRQWNLKMPIELADRIDAAARERVVGRELFLTKLLTEAMDALVPMERITRLPGRGFAAPLAPVDVDAQKQRQVDDAQRGPL